MQDLKNVSFMEEHGGEIPLLVCFLYGNAWWHGKTTVGKDALAKESNWGFVAAAVDLVSKLERAGDDVYAEDKSFAYASSSLMKLMMSSRIALACRRCRSDE